jgi:superfamily II DNA or RNA helicase
MNYPKYTNNRFNEIIYRKFQDFEIKEDKRTYNKICNEKKFELQKPQKFLKEFINPKTIYRDILIYHGIGSGKTCTAIKICEEWKNDKNIIIVVPASLKGNFRDELRGTCTDNEYLTKREKKMLNYLHPHSEEYKKIEMKSNERINKYYNIVSYHKFIEMIEEKDEKLENSLIVIDEIHNLISEEGVFYNKIKNFFKKNKKCIKVFLTATPIFDKPNEIALMLNLFNLPQKIPEGHNFNQNFISNKKPIKIINKNKLRDLTKGFISYFKGAPKIAFPEVKMRKVRCTMSDFQKKIYCKNRGEVDNNYEELERISKKMTNLPNNFYVASRLISNIVFPNTYTGPRGIKSLTKEKIKNELQTYSPKFYKMLKLIKRTDGKIFIFSNLKDMGGIETIVKILNTFDYKDYQYYGEGSNRYAIWTGDKDFDYKEEIKHIYNKKNNIYGNRLKIIIGSPSIKEGVSLLTVKQVHIMEPYWNISRIEQIIGRAKRFCSHKNLPPNERKVYVYLYLSVIEGEKTIDEYIYDIACNKEKLIQQMDKLLIENSIDCKINFEANKNDKYEPKCSN